MPLPAYCGTSSVSDSTLCVGERVIGYTRRLSKVRFPQGIRCCPLTEVFAIAGSYLLHFERLHLGTALGSDDS
jgi:hypothetical protein